MHTLQCVCTHYSVYVHVWVCSVCCSESRSFSHLTLYMSFLSFLSVLSLLFFSFLSLLYSFAQPLVLLFLVLPRYAVTVGQDSPLGNGNNWFAASPGDGKGIRIVRNKLIYFKYFN